MRRTLLIVEDDEASRDMLSRRLIKKGYQVRIARDGAQALAAFAARETEPFDLVLMDMSLPSIDGYQATRRLRELSGGDRIPVIGLSAHALPGSVEKAMAAGCDAYRTKPVDFPGLCELIESFLTAPRG